MAWSACLIEFISYFLLHEEGTTEASAGGCLKLRLLPTSTWASSFPILKSFNIQWIVMLLLTFSTVIVLIKSSRIRAALRRLLYCVDQLLCWADSEECVERLSR